MSHFYFWFNYKIVVPIGLRLWLWGTWLGWSIIIRDSSGYHFSFVFCWGMQTCSAVHIFSLIALKVFKIFLDILLFWLWHYLWVLQDPIETEKSFARRILAIVVPFSLYSSFLHPQCCVYVQHNRKKKWNLFNLVYWVFCFYIYFINIIV